MYPATFDALCAEIASHPVFSSQQPWQEQIPVEKQLLIALQRFGTYGNAGSVKRVAAWAGVAEGTVDLCTRRVMSAILDSDLRSTYIQWPSQAQREVHKQAVEDLTCKEWRDGWCMIDGTLIPLYERPYFYGETFFDRKSNYSLNVQVINTPDRIIIDYATGFVGSRGDAHCYKETLLYSRRNEVLGTREWCWGDAGYPLQEWLVIPYKKPENSDPDNKTFNYHLSRVRIGSEHTIGLLKGRLQSLRQLRVKIKTAKDLAFANFWIHTCIVVHAFCLFHERNQDNEDFLNEGLEAERRLLRRLRKNGTEEELVDGLGDNVEDRTVILARAKQFREKLKLDLLYGRE
jgi:hypothetical protein